jgi:hypothetical protein
MTSDVADDNDLSPPSQRAASADGRSVDARGGSGHHAKGRHAPVFADKGRRPFTALAAPTRSSGDERLASVLFAALTAATAEETHDVPHGFHSWPAGMPPSLARAVLLGLASGHPSGNGVVVDPFSGGGTVGLEALLHRRPFLGVDLNPLATRVGTVRTHRRTAEDADAFLAVAQGVMERSKDRVRQRVRVRAQVSDRVAASYAPHVLLELAGLLEEVDAVAVEEYRRTLAVVFSAILTKVSRRRGDSSNSIVDDDEKRIGRFLASEFFFHKAQELASRQVRLGERVGAAAPRPRFVVDDARNIAGALAKKWKRRAALVLTSPPYGGTYDYASHHAHRLEWLGLSAARLLDQEIGSRRRQANDDAFDLELTSVLDAISDCLDQDGLAVLLMGDGERAGQRIPADQQLVRLSSKSNLRVVATASAPRADWRGGSGREEHLVALSPLKSPSARF